MDTKAVELSKLIEILTFNNNIHVCIHDLCGVLGNTLLSIDAKNKIHSKKFCDIAKSTFDGYNTCVNWKIKQNSRAIDEKKSFNQICPYGICETVFPVQINGKVVCIIYVGNIINNKNDSQNYAIKTSRNSNVDVNQILFEMKNCEVSADENIGFKLANVIAGYITMVLKSENKNYGIKSQIGSYNTIYEITEYLTYNYDKNVSLKQLAKLYYINEKYLGRIFKKQIGKSFHEYLNDLRLEKSKELILKTDRTIIDISTECGFKNVTYLNRKFLQKYNLTPVEYRKKHKKT